MNYPLDLLQDHTSKKLLSDNKSSHWECLELTLPSLTILDNQCIDSTLRPSYDIHTLIKWIRQGWYADLITADSFVDRGSYIRLRTAHMKLQENLKRDKALRNKVHWIHTIVLWVFTSKTARYCHYNIRTKKGVSS